MTNPRELTYFCTKCCTELDPTEVSWCNKNLEAPPTCMLCESELMTQDYLNE